jgi:hypothetical protein
MINDQTFSKDDEEAGRDATKPEIQVSYLASQEKPEETAAMGYKQELRRNLSLWTALGLGASIIATPFGLSTSASFSLINGEVVALCI